MKRSFLSPVAIALVLLISSCGSDVKTENTADTPMPAASKPTGAEIYNRTCVSCHQSDGQGLPNVYPPLSKSDYLSDKEKTIGQVIKGSSGELVVNGKTYNNTNPPQQLNDEEVALVLTYVYSNLGNSGGTVTADEVKAVREKLK